jgi:hypothetical protein
VTEGGFLEITFTSGDVLLLDIGSDWTLTVKPSAWTDAFAEPLSRENRDFVAGHGKWTAVDVSESEAAALVGSLVESVALLHNEMNEVQGATLTAEGGLVHATLFDGELAVRFSGR